MADHDFARGFRDVDSVEQAGAFIAYLDAAQQGVVEHRTRSIAALELHTGDAVLAANRHCLTRAELFFDGGCCEDSESFAERS